MHFVYYESTTVPPKYTQMYFKYMYFMLSIGTNIFTFVYLIKYPAFVFLVYCKYDAH